MIRMIPGFIFVCLMTVLMIALMSNGGKEQRGGAMEGQALPALELVTETSEPFVLQKSSLRGKVTVFNMLASWCTPCMAEMPELMALKKALPNAHFVGLVWNDSPSRMKPWLEKYGNPFDQILYDPRGRSAIALGSRGIPETLIVDANGVIQAQWKGSLTEKAREDFVVLIRELQAKP